MPSLQIRELPEQLWRFLADRARRNRRSLAQQATIELERVAGTEMRTRRREAVARLRARLAADGPRCTSFDPVQALRSDRDR